MLRFAANLTMLFNEVSFLERFQAARDAGFDYVEYLFPYDYEAKELVNRLKQNDLQQVLFNLPPGDWDAGERGIACLPDRKSEFQAGVAKAIEYAKHLNVPRVNCLSGITSKQYSETEQWQCLLDNLYFAAETLAQHNIQLVLEPINSRIDMPGFFIDTLDKAQKVLSTVHHPNLGLQFDLYHMHIMHGDLVGHLDVHWPDIWHIQFADSQGRHEPGTGDINFKEVFEDLSKRGYQGFVSAEYRPKLDTVSSLEWLRTFN